MGHNCSHSRVDKRYVKQPARAVEPSSKNKGFQAGLSQQQAADARTIRTRSLAKAEEAWASIMIIRKLHNKTEEP